MWLCQVSASLQTPSHLAPVDYDVRVEIADIYHIQLLLLLSYFCFC